MSFLAPLYAIAALAIGLPLLFHLIQRRPKGQTPFSSLLFLNPSPPRLTRRSRLDNWLLFVLRALAILLLATAFSRPLWRSLTLQSVTTTARRTVFLVDTSASMQREDLWQQATAIIDEHLQDLQPSDEVALFTFNATVEPLFLFEDSRRLEYRQRAAAIRAALAAEKPGFATTDLGDALMTVADLLMAEPENLTSQASSSPDIVLVTDLQEGSQLKQLEGYRWPQNIAVDIRQLKVRQPSNANATVVQDSESIEAATEAISVRVQNAANSEKQQFQLVWSDQAGELTKAASYDVFVPAGESRIVRVTKPKLASHQLQLMGDDQPFDNTYYIAEREAEEKTLLLLGDLSQAADRESAFYFLTQAPLSTPLQIVTPQVEDPSASLLDLNPTQTPLTVTNVALPLETVARLKNYLENGGNLLVVLDHKSDHWQPMIDTLQILTDTPSLQIKETKVIDYAMLSKIDFQHPVFRPFAEPQFRDFTKIRFWEHRELSVSEESSWQVIASFDNGSIALVEQRQKAGHLWIMTSGWQPSQSQLALSSKFIPLLAGMLERTRTRSQLLTNYEVGTAVTMPSSAVALQVASPQGKPTNLHSDGVFSETRVPGIYHITSPTTRKSFAVNLAGEESRTEPLDVTELEKFGVKRRTSETLATLQERQRQMRDMELETRQKLWQWLLLIVLFILAAETLLAGRSINRPNLTAEASS